MPRRFVAIGDPQSSAERFFGALAAHGLLGDDGWLAREVRLVSMGDHFDYHVPEREAARVEGVRILEWLAAHDRDHVAILFGNHDAARVMELATIDDARFAEAAELARAITELPRDQRAGGEAAFAARFPELATPGYAARDYNAFTVEQRALVQRLLLAGRFQLAATAAVLGAPALLTHAGVTKRELAALGLPDDAHPQTIADALEDRLARAVAEVASDWRADRSTPLSLEPLHIAGAAGEEGGGLLYHRPSDPERPGADLSWEQGHAPRRYDPRCDLPRGLVQVIGHTGHRKASKEMPRWRWPDDDDAPGGVRTLRVAADGAVTYRRGVHRGAPDDAIVYMTDPEMHYVSRPADVAMLELG